MLKSAVFPPVVAASAGALAVLAWAPFGWWWAGLAAYAVFFSLLIHSRQPLQAACLGLAFGFGLHAAGHGWMFQTLHAKTGMALLPSALYTAIFLTYLSLYIALPCAIWRALASAPTTSVRPLQPKDARSEGRALWFSAMLLASLLTTGEWARGVVLNGFTSLSLGYSFLDTWLVGYAPVLGVYGMSWVAYMALACLVTDSGTTHTLTKAILFLVVLIAGWGLQRIEWTSPAGSPLTYRLIQANIAQEAKFDPAFRTLHVERLVKLISSAPADMIVTPETAFPLFLNELPSTTLTDLQQFSRASNSHLFLGIASSGTGNDAYNSTVFMAPQSAELAQYQKVRLMPFGEYSPFGFGWFSNSLNVPLKDLVPGSPTQPPFELRGQKIGTLICHEDLIGNEARRWVPDAGVIVNPTNLGWFEKSLAIEQRFQIVRMRAAEIARPILRASNTGITAHINHKGAVAKLLPASAEGVLTGEVIPMTGKTLYTLLGDWPVLIGSLTVILLSVFRRIFSRSRHSV